MEIYHRIFESGPDAMIVVDPAGRIALANARAEALFGYARGDLVGQAIELLMPQRFRSGHVRHRTGYLAAAHSRPMGEGRDLFGLRKDGSEFPVDIMLSPLHVQKGLFVLCVVRDISVHKRSEDQLRQQAAELRKLNLEVRELASRDGLTGLLNRRAFAEHATQMLRNAHRRQERIAVLMLDIDHFKQVNDRYGHAAGDAVLKAIAAALQRTARETDIVARYGGEEFVVAMPALNARESLAAGERLRAAVAAIADAPCPVTASIGAVTSAEIPSGDMARLLERLLDQADQALYAAKEGGRNQVRQFGDLPQGARLQQA